MLYVYRRHIKSCRFWTGKTTNGNRRNNNCRCPVWMDGYLSSKRINKSLGIRDWTRGNEIIRDWEIEGTILEEVPAGVSIQDACDAFMADAEAQHLSGASLKKYRILLVNRHTPKELERYSPS